jgi:hypothetical protein
MDPQDVSKLIGLKRYESPGEKYFENFLDDFHQKQRRDLLQFSSRQLFAERVATWVSPHGRVAWMVPAGAVAAALAAGLYFVLPMGEVPATEDRLAAIPASVPPAQPAANMPLSMESTVQLNLPRRADGAPGPVTVQVRPQHANSALVPVNLRGSLREL